MYKATALLMVNAMLAMASPMATPAAKLEERRVGVVYKAATVTHYVYPNGRPAKGHGSNDKSSEADCDEDKPKEDPKPVVYVAPTPKPKKAATHPTYKQPAAPPMEEAAPATGNYADPGTDFVENCLYHHNMHRANHSASDVTWDDRLASAAQMLADTCDYGHNTDLGGGGYGQNIAMKYGTGNLGSELDFQKHTISNGWYGDELPLYPNNYGGEPSMSNFHKWGHYSQIVWKGSQKIGCAVKKCANMKGGMAGFYSVCNYEPAGNVAGRYGQNVGAPKGMPSIDGPSDGGY